MAGNSNSGRRAKRTTTNKVTGRDKVALVLRDIWNGKYADRPADAAVDFINALSHSTGDANETFNLRPWQEDFIRKLLGTTRPDGLRQYRKALLLIARKNGKSELAAAICLYFLFADKERGAEVYSAASKKDQAARIYKAAKLMIDASPYLSSITDCLDVSKRIKVVDGPGKGNVFEALSADIDGALGLNPSCVVFDEVLVGSERLWDALETAQGARRQPLFLAISTAGPYDPNSLLYKQYQFAKDVMAGIVPAPTFLPVIYEVPQDADWKDEQNWYLANPALGDFRDLEEMRVRCEEAKRIPSKETAFRMFYCNQFTESAQRWLSAEIWNSCTRAFDRASLRGRVCYMGLDLSTVSDLTALVCVFPDGNNVDVLPFLFLPADRLQALADRYKVPYDLWLRQGHLIATPGKTVDYAYIRRLANELANECQVRSITYDRWNSSQLITELKDDGFDCVPLGQGIASMNAPMKLCEKMVYDGSLRHNGNPVLAWNIASTVQSIDAAGNVKPDKEKSTGGKIDGTCALLNALDTYSRAQQQEASYEVYVV